MVPDQAKTELFRFDPRGNIYEADPGGPLRVYGKGNRLLRKGDTLYTWDDDGRLVEKRITYPGEDDGEGGAKPDEVWRYRWNAAGLLSQVTRPDGAKVRFVYDPFARRMGKGVVPGKRSELAKSNTRFVWDGDVLAHEIRVTGRDSGDPVVEERTYLFEDESFEPAAHEESGEWVHYVNDQIGTPHAFVSHGAHVMALVETNAWSLRSSGAPTRLALPGQQADEEASLSYSRFRYYDPDVGRFVSSDPNGLRAPVNTYQYAPNRMVWADPFGLDWLYRLRDKDGRVYYHGRASDKDTLAGVASRHAGTSGEDGKRMTDTDVIEQLTPKGTPRDAVRGLEEKGITEGKTKTGRRACTKTGDRGRARGNKIAGSSDPAKAKKHGEAADKYLDSIGASSVPDLPALDTHKRGKR